MRYLFILLILSLSVLTHADDSKDYLAARDAFRNGQLQKLPAYAARLKDSPLLPYLQYWQLTSQIKTASADDIRYFIDRNSDTPLSNKLRVDWLRLLAQQQDWATYLDLYPLAVNPDLSLQCYALQGRVQQNQPTAITEAKQLWLTNKDLPSACDPLFIGLINGQQISNDNIWQRIRLLLANNNSASAMTWSEYLDTPLTDKQLNLANTNPENFLSSDNLNLKLRDQREIAIYAVTRLATKDAAQAVQQWQLIKDQFPKADRQYTWAQIAYHAARQHLPEAYDWFEHSDLTQLSDEQHAWRVRAALWQGNWRNVQTSILAMPESERNEAAWRYWLARAYKIQNKTLAANTLFVTLSKEYNFYGLLAEEELGATVGNLTINVNVSNDEIAAIQRIPAIQRALALYQMDLRTEANNEWSWATRDFDDRRLLAAAELALQYNWLDRAINTADRTQQLHNFDLRFLAPYRDKAKQYAKESGLDEAWVYGLIRQESRFVSHAKSGVGASGLMQIMPATAHWIAKKLGIKRFQTEDLHDMDTNMQFGMYYLKTIQQSLDNSDVLATAAYNAGPSRARRWRADHAIEGAIYAENIPFSETRDYVKKVISNAIFYARRFDEPETSIKTRLGTITGNNLTCADADSNSPACTN
ncbi:transglycosylase SLT domain-containing protein [Sulfuriferula nivalis]|uniref:Transglycosylase n=1 Tax=Sulfuriferula nivalis TaxID=2675298 RepID=A0A809SIK3_9PROT|nr:transglycosylase SLT domain-containing protein [Sulfuriferula nivalis]BBP02040.1 transglycosylase [Sulfuriferula nivalis]